MTKQETKQILRRLDQIEQALLELDKAVRDGPYGERLMITEITRKDIDEIKKRYAQATHIFRGRRDHPRRLLPFRQ